MKLWIRLVALAIVAFALGGCSKTFMCRLNGTSCPASPNAGASEPEAAPPEAAAEEAPAAQQAAPKAACKRNGEEVTNTADCCSNHSENRGYLHNGGTLYCCQDSSTCHNTPE